MSIIAMKLALEALKYIGYVPREGGSHPIEKAITALRTAIQEAEACEPVAYQEFTETGEWFLSYGKHPTAKQNPLFLAAGAQVQQEAVAWDVEESVLAIHRIVKSAASFSTKEGALRSELKSVFQAGKAQPSPHNTGATNMSLSKRLRAGVECAPWVIEEVKKLEAEHQALSNDINDYQNIIESQLRELERLRPKKPMTMEESINRMAARLRADKELKEKLDAVWRAQGICPDCEGKGEQGGQFTGGTWECETCQGTGKYE